MSGGGGGRIIIRSLLRQAASTTAVRDSLVPEEVQRLDGILSQNEAYWTRRDDRFVVHCIGSGLEECGD